MTVHRNPPPPSVSLAEDSRNLEPPVVTLGTVVLRLPVHPMAQTAFHISIVRIVGIGPHCLFQLSRPIYDLLVGLVFALLHVAPVALLLRIPHFRQRILVIARHEDHQLIYLLLQGWLVTVQTTHVVLCVPIRPIVRLLPPRLQIWFHDVTGGTELRLLVIVPEDYSRHTDHEDDPYDDPHCCFLQCINSFQCSLDSADSGA